MGTRDRTREAIVDAARELFLHQGLLAVSMGDIAERADCARRNLYRYFPAKEDLSYTVAIELLKEWNNYQNSVYETLHGSGLDKLRSFLVELAAYLENQKPLLRFMAEFDFVFRDGGTFRPDTPTAESFASVIHVTEDLLEQILAAGCTDGSIRLFAPAEVLIPTMTTVLWGMGQRIAIRDELIREEFSVPGIDLVRTQIDVYVRALSAVPVSG